MLTPSYSELMDVIKQGERLDNRVTSRYTVVLAAAKRARQLTDGANPLTYAPTDRAVSIAVKEMNEGKLRIRVQDRLLDEKPDTDRYHLRAVSALSKDDLREDLKQDYAPTPYDRDNDSDDEIFPAYESEESAADSAPKEEEDLALYEDTGNEEDFSEDAEESEGE